MKLTRDPARVIAGGHEVTQQMPLTAAALEKQRPAEQHDPLLVGSPMPKSIGRCADLYHDVRELRLLMDKEVEAIKARETEIQEYIIANLSKSDDTGAAGLRYRAQVRTEDKPQIADWAAFTLFVAENDRFDLIQKRLGEKAVADMWDKNETVPGVAKVHVPKLSITKI